MDEEKRLASEYIARMILLPPKYFEQIINQETKV